MASKTTKRKKMGDYNKFFVRKKEFVPAFPNALNGKASSQTSTTTALFSRGAVVSKAKVVGAGSLTGFEMDAQNDEVVLNWKAPDDLYIGNDTHVWLVFAFSNSTTSTGSFSYDVKYSLNRIIDFGLGGTAENITEAATAMDTDLDEALTYLSTTNRKALYRGMRGTINGGKIEQGDIVEFKVEADAAPVTGVKLTVIGLEIDYAVSLRSQQIENYE